MTIINESAAFSIFKDAHGCIRYIAIPYDPHSHAISLHIYEVSQWSCDGNNTPDYETAEEVATMYIKWDGCSHIGFRSPDLGKNWVHVCGADHMKDLMEMLRHFWNACVRELKSRGFDEHGLQELTTIGAI